MCHVRLGMRKKLRDFWGFPKEACASTCSKEFTHYLGQEDVCGDFMIDSVASTLYSNSYIRYSY
jgi:hypothetical protein